MGRRFTLFLGVLLAAVVTLGNDTKKKNSAQAYIEKYSDLAVEEMYRSGIPASITLAQGMLESGNGRSRLAVEGNNHFGIKCHRDWTGERIYADDDAKGECFRKYPQALDSYKDHSDFLRFKERYAFLFDYELTDYKSWAYGLKKAGYATDPSYAQKLIATIETYGLSRFDTMKPEGEPNPEVPQTPTELSQPERFTGEGKTGTFAVYLAREIMEVNRIPFVYAREGETYRTIAMQYDLFPKELAKINDDTDADRKLAAGERVYLKRKAAKAVKGMDKHVCTEGETLREVSQKYAIRLKSLMKMNKITDADIPLAENQTLWLTSNRK